MRIGLTGGIASGKSTVSAAFRALGAQIVDADEVARAVVAPGSPGLAALVRAFGPEILCEGQLDRARLGQRVFGDPQARQTLEAITHPLIAAESTARLEAAQASGAPLVIYDAALLVESGRAEAFRPLVVVTLPPELQRARLMARDGLSAAQAQARLDAQLPLHEKAALADHLIDNSGPPEQTVAQVRALWRTWFGALPPEEGPP